MPFYIISGSKTPLCFGFLPFAPNTVLVWYFSFNLGLCFVAIAAKVGFLHLILPIALCTIIGIGSVLIQDKILYGVTTCLYLLKALLEYVLVTNVMTAQSVAEIQSWEKTPDQIFQPNPRDKVIVTITGIDIMCSVLAFLSLLQLAAHAMVQSEKEARRVEKDVKNRRRTITDTVEGPIEGSDPKVELV